MRLVWSAVCLAILVLAGCASNKFVGTWTAQVPIAGQITMVLNQDGKGVLMDEGFQWEADGRGIKMKFAGHGETATGYLNDDGKSLTINLEHDRVVFIRQ